MEAITSAMNVFFAIWGSILGYRLIYLFIGLFVPSKKFKKTDKKYNYAVLVSARNEELVITQLIESIKKQDYPADKISIFVVAHNCTDSTAEKARAAGANVYEFKSKKRRKGVALDYLLKQIKEKYSTPEQPNGILAFDGYFVFDADNLLATDYVSQMNNAFDNKNYDGFTSYVNMKNVSTTAFASYSSFCLFLETVQVRRPMGFLGISQPLRGTGKLLRSRLFENGYPWFTLTEDTQFSNQIISKGYRTSYCEKAIYFDEQPLTFKILARQRMRWTRGGIILFFKSTPALLWGIFAPYHKKTNKNEKRRFNLFSEFQKRFSCFDRLILTIPVWVLQFAIGTLYPIIAIFITLFTGGGSLAPMLALVILYYVITYINNLLYFALTLLREHRNMRIRPAKILRHIFVIPFIAMIMDYVSFVAVFYSVKWKPIPHVIGKEIEEVQNEKTLAYYVYQHWNETNQQTKIPQQQDNVSNGNVSENNSN